MAGTRTLYNATDGPVLVDDEGHVLGAREHLDTDLEGPVLDALLESGRVIVVEQPKPTKARSKAATSPAPSTEEA